MGSDVVSALRPTLVMLALFALLLCGAYPLAIYGLGQSLFPAQANGSLVHEGNRVVGSSLIGQSFTSDRYFWPRPSAAGAGYDARASSGSNLGPTSAVLVGRVKADLGRYRATGFQGPAPADLVTASASGLDPDISPAAANVQIARVAKARGLQESRVRALVQERADNSLLGDPFINVLELNRQLDRLSANMAK
jgi:potassium-transporting ATPase KdpC subunit